MPITQVTIRQSYLGKDIYNVYHYLSISWDNYNPTVLAELCVEAATTILSAVNPIQVAGVDNVSITAVAVADANIQATIPAAGAGTLTTTEALYLPSAQTYGFRLTVGQSRDAGNSELYSGNRRITHGYKYFTGVSDAVIDNGEWASAFENGDPVNVVQGALHAVLTTDNGGTQDFTPVVYGKPIPATPNLPARDWLYAPIIGAVLAPPTWLRKRK